jgi:hypothetical protein
MSEPFDTRMREYGTAMRRVSDEELQAHHGGDDLVRALSFLGMGCFEAGFSYEFGPLAADFPPHDRWLYSMQKQDVVARDSWRTPAFREYKACGQMLHGALDDDLVFELEELYELISRPLLDFKLSEMEWAERMVLQHAALSAWRTLGHHGLEAHYVRLNWDQDLHDLLHHTASWRASHPEFEDLPHELLLRMYGLGPYVDLTAEGYQILR